MASMWDALDADSKNVRGGLLRHIFLSIVDDVGDLYLTGLQEKDGSCQERILESIGRLQGQRRL